MNKLIQALCVILIALFVALPSSSAAAKKKVTKKVVKKAAPAKTFKKTSAKNTRKNSATLPIGASIRLRADRRAVIATFTGATSASSIQYMLSYDSDGGSEGVIGSITPGKQKTIVRELLFGTCSSGVCRYHTGVTNAYLEVTVTSKKGTYVKTYPIYL